METTTATTTATTAPSTEEQAAASPPSAAAQQQHAAAAISGGGGGAGGGGCACACCSQRRKQRRHVLVLDLEDDAALISEYVERHKAVPSAVEARIYEGGVDAAEIFLAGNRLVLLLETGDRFAGFEAKAAGDAAHEETQRWERAMWRYQRALPFAAPGEKWCLTRRVWQLGGGGGGGDGGTQ